MVKRVPLKYRRGRNIDQKISKHFRWVILKACSAIVNKQDQQLFVSFVESDRSCNSMQPVCPLHTSISNMKCPPAYSNTKKGEQGRFSRGVVIPVSSSSVRMPKHRLIFSELMVERLRNAENASNKASEIAANFFKRLQFNKFTWLFLLLRASVVGVAISGCHGRVAYPRMPIISVKASISSISVWLLLDAIIWALASHGIWASEPSLILQRSHWDRPRQSTI